MKLLRNCLVLLAALGAASPVIAGARIFLPTSVTPEHYRIAITPDPGSLSFNGTVDIDIQVKVPTREIVLNGADLVIDQVAVAGVATAPRVRYESADETVHFTLPTTLDPGVHTLRIAAPSRDRVRFCGCALGYGLGPH